MTIAERTDVLTALGFTSSNPTDAQLALIKLVHPLAESVFFAWFGSYLEYEQHVEYLPIGSLATGDELAETFHLQGQQVQVRMAGHGSRVLQLPHTPVWNTSLEVREDVGGYAGQSSGAFATATILTQGTDYWLDISDVTLGLSTSGLLHRFGDWPQEPRSVKVTYYGGEKAARLAAKAGNLKYACLLTIIKAYKTLVNMQGSSIGPKISESIGKYSYTRSSDIVKALTGFTVPYEAQRAAWPARNFGRIFG